MFFPWNDQFNVGVDEVDQQHRILVRLINDLYMAIHENKSTEVISPILTELKDYTRVHFATETAMMEEAGYAGLDDHRREHDMMIARIGQLETRQAKGRMGTSVELLIFLRDWLATHICETDRAMAEALTGGDPWRPPSGTA